MSRTLITLVAVALLIGSFTGCAPEAKKDAGSGGGGGNTTASDK